MDAVIKHAGALHQADVAAWQEEALVVSKYAQGLQQLDNGKKISPNPQVTPSLLSPLTPSSLPVARSSSGLTSLVGFVWTPVLPLDRKRSCDGGTFLPPNARSVSRSNTLTAKVHRGLRRHPPPIASSSRRCVTARLTG